MPFPKDFLWGAASASYQVEGAAAEDGKVPGIWDALYKGHVKRDENAAVSADHYHHYKEDVALMKQIGLKSYRFSVSWPRVMPEKGVINPAGIAFYQNLVRELKEAGIEPLCTLYHWDMPMWVYEQGGWLSAETPQLFAEYAAAVTDALSGDVRYWMTFNEPSVFVANGYIAGGHAPFVKTVNEPAKMMQTVSQIARNVLLAHGLAVSVIRERARLAPKIGLALAADIHVPCGSDDEKGAREKTLTVNKLVFSAPYWMDPILKGKLPKELAGVISAEELAVIHKPLDFFGFNCYNSVSYSDGFGGKNPNRFPGMPVTSLGWPITPDVLYWGAKFFYEEYGLPLLITENGMANLDFVMSDGKVHDPQRIEYMRSYLSGVKKALDEGIPVLGYTYWSIMDNFEWAEGYDPRFGLIYVDYRTQKRTLKDSAFYYRDVIASNGEIIP